MIGAEVFAGAADFAADAGEQLVVNYLALVVGFLVEVEDFDKVGPLAGQFLVPDDVHMQLVTGNLNAM